MEALFANRNIVTRDIHQVYAGLYLEAITSFEQLIEQLFIGLLSGRIALNGQTSTPLVSFRSARAVRPILFQNRAYLDWLPYSQTERRANDFFRNGLPFSSLDHRDKDLIQQCIYTRNAIAHKSTHSLEMFRKHVLGTQNLMAKERRPIGYLRSIFRASPQQNRYEHFIQGMASVAAKLCT